MHDPMVVAFDINLPIPTRKRYREHADAPRWTLGVRRRTNAENLGQRVYPWWRPKGYEPRIAGRSYGWRDLATIWHVEPGGRDSGEVCKHYRRTQLPDGTWSTKYLRGWKWHLWHWHIQVVHVQRLGRWLFERCIECGRRYPWGYAPVSHSWSEPGGKWFRVQRRAYHHECSSLVHMRQAATEHELIHERALAALAIEWDIPIADVPERLFAGSDGYHWDKALGRAVVGEFNLRRRLDTLIEKATTNAD